MSSPQRIRDAFYRMQHVFAKRPAVALATATMRARIIDGLRCEARISTLWVKQHFHNAYLPITPPRVPADSVLRPAKSTRLLKVIS